MDTDALYLLNRRRTISRSGYTIQVRNKGVISAAGNCWRDIDGKVIVVLFGEAAMTIYAGEARNGTLDRTGARQTRGKFQDLRRVTDCEQSMLPHQIQCEESRLAKVECECNMN
jgi:hypothetical protein